jgi:glyoxylase-like metal-dependent hydrolase (beta-lactamase superfamily II)
MSNPMHPVPCADFGRISVHFGAQNGKYPDGNQVLVRGTDTIVAFDTPLVSNRFGSQFGAVDIVMLGHVHEDHMAGLHRLPHATIYVPEADLPAARSWEGLSAAYGLDKYATELLRIRFERDFHYAPRADAVGYEDGAVWDLGKVKVRAFHMPGHTPGHSVLLIEPDGIAFIGDIDLSSFGPYYGDANSSLEAFRNTLDHLSALPAKVWITFHHRGVYTDRETFRNDLAAYRSKIDQREKRILDLLRESPRTLAQLVHSRVMYPQGYEELWVNAAETRTISQHLSELIQQGRVGRHDEGVFELA